MRGSVTKVRYANKEKYTLETTIPAHVRDYLEIMDGSKIEWTLNKEDGEWEVIIRKVKTPKKV